MLLGFFSNVIPEPVQNIFNHSHDENKENNDNQIQTKEHGNLAFFGRDIARKLVSAVGSVQEKLKLSPATEGLDANKSFFNGMLSTFKDRVRAIYPGKLQHHHESVRYMRGLAYYK